MYNEERKKRYIKIKENAVTLPYRSLSLLFEKTAPFEEKNGKDVCEWTPREIMDYYKYLDAYSLSSLVVVNSNLTQYTNWCLTETLVPDGQNHFQEIRPDMLNSCVNKKYLDQMIISRENLVKMVDELPNYTDRFMILAFFEGICGPKYSDMTSAKITDIHEDRIALVSGKEQPISSKLKDIATFAAEEDSYQTYGATGKSIKYSDLNESDIIFKVAKKNRAGNNDSAMTQIVCRRFSKATEYIGLPGRMTIKNMMISGKINYIKDLMDKENLQIEEVIAKYKKQIDTRYDVEKIISPVVFMRKYGQYFE